MKIINPNEGFLIKIHQTLNILESTFIKRLEPYTNSAVYDLNLWEGVYPGFSELSIFKKPDKNGLIQIQLDYYDYCNNGELYYTPIFFGNHYKRIDFPLFNKILNKKINRLDQLLEIPFRNDNGSAYENYEKDLVEYHNNFVEDLRRFYDFYFGVMTGNKDISRRPYGNPEYSEQEAYLNFYNQESKKDPLFNFELDKSWNSLDERNSDKFYNKWLRSPYKVTIFDGWYSYLFWELKNSKSLGHWSVVCNNCGRILDLEKGEHADRKFCKKNENIRCWRDRSTRRKAYWRRDKSKKNKPLSH